MKKLRKWPMWRKRQKNYVYTADKYKKRDTVDLEGDLSEKDRPVEAN